MGVLLRPPNGGSRRLGSQPNLKEQVGGHLRELILSGELRPGERIDQDQLADDLGVSKLPVREALIVLESEGLVENVARRGSFVAPLTRDDVRDHYVIYGIVSGLAARRAAQRLSDEALEDLEEIVARMGASEDPVEQEELNFLFHKAINRAGGSRRLTSVLRLLSNTIPAHFFEFTTDWPERAIDDHRHITAALRRRDADEAAELVSEHLRAGGEFAVRMLEEAQFWADED